MHAHASLCVYMQDTLVTIRALTSMANLSFSQNVSLNEVLDLPGDNASHHDQLTHNNRYTKQVYEVHADTVSYI